MAKRVKFMFTVIVDSVDTWDCDTLAQANDLAALELGEDRAVAIAPRRFNGTFWEATLRAN